MAGLDLIEQHYRQVWHAEPQLCPWSAGLVHQLPPAFSVLKVPPHGSRKLWTYATRCMSVPGDIRPIELDMFSPWQTDAIAELLVATAHFHRTCNNLGVGHSVWFGRPWMDGSACDHELISLDYLDGPELKTVNARPQTPKFYWLVPITASEVAYKGQHGLDALEEKFERSGLDYANPLRPPVI